MSVQWHEAPDAQAAAEAAARFVIGRLEDAVNGSDRAAFAISGGSSPKALFQCLATARFRWDRVHFFWVDERCVPPDHPDSNFRMAQETLLGPARIGKKQIHRIQGELRPEVAAQRYQEDIREFFELEDGALPQFDLVQLGLGPDGHTASLFPGEPLMEDRTGIAAAVYVEKFNSWRVTLLPGVLLAAHHTFFFVTGKEKAAIVRAVLNDPYNPRRYPSQIIAHHGHNVAWFVDGAAAGKQ